ncbi:MAG: HAD-IA family hydrolase [Candidimonas sp.]
MLIIFDLDGVLIDSKDIHYEALNIALKEFGDQYAISREEHLSTYDGLPTKSKLLLLSEQKQLPPSSYETIWTRKQQITSELFKTEISENKNLIDIFKKLKQDNIKIAVGSNSIRETVKIILLRLGLMEYVDFYISNEDVKKPKPNNDMYLTAIMMANETPHTTIILEDSPVGREAALASGANLLPIDSTEDVSYELIQNFISSLSINRKKWKSSKMINILIPMAGQGSRFALQGYKYPKPLIDVNGKSMIQTVVDNLNIEGRYIFVVQREHYETYNLKHFLKAIEPKCEVIISDGLTEGAACTTLLAKDLINNDNPLIMANSDQFVEWDSEKVLYEWTYENVDGGILTFESDGNPKWSYAKTNSDGVVTEVAEKNPISDLATVGIYYWKHGKDYVQYAEQMISKNIRVNNEFYVCPVFNEAIEDGKVIKTKNAKKMWGLGTPEDLTYFLENYENSNIS